MRPKERMEFRGSKAEGRFAIVWLTILTAGVELFSTVRRAMYVLSAGAGVYYVGPIFGLW